MNIPATINNVPVTSIGNGAFQNATGPTSATIPASVTTIGINAFAGCTNLKMAIFMGNAPSMGSGVFASTAGGFTVYYFTGATGFASPNWTDSPGGNSYKSISVPTDYFIAKVMRYTQTGTGAPVLDGGSNAYAVELGSTGFPNNGSILSMTLTTAGGTGSPITGYANVFTYNGLSLVDYEGAAAFSNEASMDAAYNDGLFTLADVTTGGTNSSGLNVTGPFQHSTRRRLPRSPVQTGRVATLWYRDPLPLPLIGVHPRVQRIWYR